LELRPAAESRLFMDHLTRRNWLFLTGACAALRPVVASAAAQPTYYRDYSRCLPDHLAAVASRAYRARNREIASLVNPQAIAKRQEWARATFWSLAGGQPERTPLNARKTGQFTRPGYTLEKLIYESRPGVFVSANLYIPTAGKPPYPGVLFQMGHSGQGKAYPSYQKCCQGLARLGYLVLAFDPMGQGERIDYPDASGTGTRLASVDEEHNVPGKQLLLLGDTASRHQVWDAIRSLDYLAVHPLVDPARLASTGQSGGATLTMLLACADARLSAAVVSSGNTENFACKDFDPPGSTDDAEQDLVGSGLVGFDRWDLLYPIAPKPLLVLVSEHDFFGTYSPRYLSSGIEEYEKLAGVYRVLGKPDSLQWKDTPLPHGLTYSLRLDTYNWFERWLKQSDRKIENEPPVEPETESTLWVGATGNVSRDFHSMRPFDLIAKKAGAARNSSKANWMESLSIRLPARDLKLRSVASTRFGAVRVEAVEMLTAPSVWVPAWLFIPDRRDKNLATVLALDAAGRNLDSHEDGLYHRLARIGRVVCAADVRGIGDTRPEVGRGNPGYTIEHDSEDAFAWASLILGEPLLAQRVGDVLALAQGLRNHPAVEGTKLAIAARGRLTVPALFAFAASPLADSLYLEGGLISYRSVLETEQYRQPLSNFAYDIARIVDLPQLAAEAAPRQIRLAGMVDAAGKRMSTSSVKAAYSAGNVVVSADASWDNPTLGSL
jgi:dienelactone hydrolase